MGGVAALAREAGHTVTGCDIGVYPPMSDQLRALGIALIDGFDEDQIETLASRPDMYVIGNVVSRARAADGQPTFPLMERILNEGLPYTSGPQWLSEHVLQGRHVLAVAGTHGKTTTSAMLTWVLQETGCNPGFLVGGVPLNFGVSARLGDTAPGQARPLFVIEADEYDTAFFDKRSKFVHYRPRTAILNNLEFDHADIFDDLAAIERQFAHLVRTLPSTGLLVSEAGSDALTRVLAQGVYCDVTLFGDTQTHWHAAGTASQFDVLRGDDVVGHVDWTLSGAHNQRNALACLAAATHVGVKPSDACAALSQFQNVRRRMERKGGVAVGAETIEVIDDFAHHPTAIETTLAGLRGVLDRTHPTSRILAVFEPRSNTMKTGTLKSRLAASLQHADLAFCYTNGLTWDAAQVLAPLGAQAICDGDLDALIQRVVAEARPGDRVVCMSNGSFGGIHEKLLSELTARFTV